MSNANSESTANFAALSGESSGAATSGLETIVLALQALQKEPRRNVYEKEPTVPNSNFPDTTSTNTPPIPHGMNSARRVVSTDTIGECDTESTPLEHPPQVKEEQTVSSSEKLSNTTCSTPVASGTSSSARSSPLLSSPPSKMAMDDSPPLTDDTSADFSHILADPEGWLKKTENLFVKLPPVDRTSDKEIIVQPNDVLCGRGGETNHHPGNIRYRSLVKAYQKLYLLAKRRDKPKIAQCIVVSVRGVEGRFLKRTKNANKVSAWVDVGNVKAREKTSQALREGAPNLRENVNPPVTSTASNDNTTAISARQVLVPDQAESIAVPSSSTAPLATSAPTALQSMMGWKWQEAAKLSSLSSSSVPHTSSSLSAAPSEAENDAYMKLFTKAAAQLMQHPAFHQLDQARQYEAIMYECKNARAAVESAKHEQGRTSPMIPTAAMKQQQAPQPQQHRQPHSAHDYPYYNHGQRHFYPPVHGNYWQDSNTKNPKAPSGMDVKPDNALSLLSSKFAASQADKNVDLQSMYRDLLVAKAAASSGLKGLPSAIKKEEESTPNEERRIKIKKRPVSSTSTAIQSITSNTAVVSDTGSETSSSTSSCESLSTSTAVKVEKTEAVTSVSRGGSRLKRLKLRMKSDFN
mmetsp:Transcript_22069/g.54594  ORF Transcript_22069/g.54594 Transcript_22069/m.54594 type:complete len:635 (+) Transcript_22069:215-2119(+)